MMMGASNLMMGLTLVLVICLAVVLGLVLVLLAELYCTTLLRRRNTSTNAAAGESLTALNNPQPSVANFYTQSILTAPRSILYPSVTSGAGADIEKPPENQESVQENGNSGRREEGLVYISNPMFDDENGRRSKAAATGNTPFETPDTSPSRLETEDDDEEDEVGEEMTSVKVVVVTPPLTPPLTPMKKLPKTVEGGGDINSGSNNGGGGVSSSASSSGTPCTSLSW